MFSSLTNWLVSHSSIILCLSTEKPARVELLHCKCTKSRYGSGARKNIRILLFAVTGPTVWEKTSTCYHLKFSLFSECRIYIYIYMRSNNWFIMSLVRIFGIECSQSILLFKTEKLHTWDVLSLFIFLPKPGAKM